jgi:hypothetical protein
MNPRTRRAFLEDVGRGMLAASLGSAVTLDLGIAPCFGDEPGQRLTFDRLEPLVRLLQETPPDTLMPLVVDKLKSGTPLETLVTAAALANARAFGGHDYTGYHTFMALLPAYRMAGQLPVARRPLPVLKVLYRNSSRIQEQNAAAHDALHPVEETNTRETVQGDEALRDAVRALDLDRAESHLATISKRSPSDAFNQLQLAVQDEVNVHRIVLAWRAWAMLDLTGQQYAHSLLRQSVRFCFDSEKDMTSHGRSPSSVREVLPRLIDEYGLLKKPLGDRAAEDKWVNEFAELVFTGTREEAADAAAAALAEGIQPEHVAEAISLAANSLVLYDPGRSEKNSTPQKPPGCVHGDSAGVHASDAANAWRNIARVANHRNQVASLVVDAYHTAGQAGTVAKDPYHYASLLGEIKSQNPDELLRLTEQAIRANDQARACAVVHRYGELDLPSQPVFELLLKYAVSEDGALHAEKFYCTVSEEFATTRPAFRWRQLVALARVTASEFGYPAPGIEQARELLGVA